MTATLTTLINTHLTVVTDRVKREALSVLETGSIRSTETRYRDGDGWSTLAFAHHAKRCGGFVTSVDLDTTAAHAVLEKSGLNPCVTLVTGHSVDVLAGYLDTKRKFDFILLDSDNDADLILHEYYLALRLIRDGGIIMIDDVEPGSHEVLKGNKLIPHLIQANKPFIVHKRAKGNTTTGVAVVEF